MRKATNHKITRAPKPAVTPTGSAPTITTHPASKPKLLSRPRTKATPKPIPTPLVGPPVIVPVPVAEIPLQEQMPPIAPMPTPPAEATTTAPTPPVEAPVPTPPVNVAPAPSPVNAAPATSTDTGIASVVEWAIDGKKPPENPVLPLVEVGPTVPAILTVPPAAETPAIVEWASKDIPPPTDAGATPPEGVAPAPIVESDPAPVPAPTESDPETAPTESEATGLPLTTEPPPPAPTVPVFSIPPTHAVEDVSSIQIGDVLIVAIKVMPMPPVPPPGGGVSEERAHGGTP